MFGKTIDRHLCAVALLLVPLVARADVPPLDSLMNLPVIIVPTIRYVPETGWSFGGAVQAYFHIGNAKRMSQLQFNGAYTLNRQWFINAGGNLYFERTTPWMIRFSGGYRDYPDLYYKPESGPLETPSRYLSRRGYARLQAMVNLPHHWDIGGDVHFVEEQTSDWSLDVTPRAGMNGMLMWGLGPVIQHDSRDVMYYPNRGLFFKTAVSYYAKALGSDISMLHWTADLRHYLSVPLTGTYHLIFAWQFKTIWAVSTDGEDVPFQMLPTFGGEDLMRGIRTNMYRDDAMLSLQAEMRIPIWNILNGCVFAGAGDVYNIKDWQWRVPKVSYGLGLRASINKDKVMLRFDVARTNINNSWKDPNAYSFYLTATEAF